MTSVDRAGHGRESVYGRQATIRDDRRSRILGWPLLASRLCSSSVDDEFSTLLREPDYISAIALDDSTKMSASGLPTGVEEIGS